MGKHQLVRSTLGNGKKVADIATHIKLACKELEKVAKALAVGRTPATLAHLADAKELVETIGRLCEITDGTSNFEMVSRRRTLGSYDGSYVETPCACVGASANTAPTNAHPKT